MSSYKSAPRFVFGPTNSEDLAAVPQTRWLIASGMRSAGHPQGHLYLVDRETHTSTVLFPDRVDYRPDVATYGNVERPAVDAFDAHGVALRPAPGGHHMLYVVNHGGRESVEVFDVAVDSEGDVSLSWVGAVIQAPGVWGNAVTPLPDGGIAVTNYLDLNDPTAFDKVYAGEVTGNLKEWHPGEGWTDVPESAFSSPNGLEVSPDGRWYFVNSWSPKRFVRLSRGADPVRRDEIDVDMLPDNVKWSPDGRLLITGQESTPAEVFARFNVEDVCEFPFHVLAIDPETLETEVLVRLSHEEFGTASTALIVGSDLWVGSARSDRIACFDGS